MACQLYGIGNALVDSEYLVSEAVLDQSGFNKGTMTLVDADERSSLITLLEDTAGISMSKLAGGGSAANTIVTAALLGTETFYSCKVASDRTGDFFVNDLVGLGIQTGMSGQRPDGVTGECISMITPDGERTLVTHLGINGSLSSSEIDPKALSAAQFLYIEGYLVSSETAFDAVLGAQRIALDNQVAVSLTLSDVGMVENFRAQFDELVSNGVDFIFCNEEEAKLWTRTESRLDAANALATQSTRFAMTLSGDGAYVSGEDGKPCFVAADKVQALDTTGAGDTFAGAVLSGLIAGESLSNATVKGHELARTVVSRFGARISSGEI